MDKQKNLVKFLTIEILNTMKHSCYYSWSSWVLNWLLSTNNYNNNNFLIQTVNIMLIKT